MRLSSVLLFLLLVSVSGFAQKTPRERGIPFGVLSPGPANAITDVAGVLVGQVTLEAGDSVRTGVTAILPHGGNVFQDKVPAAIYLGNGFGKLAGYSQVRELGNLETPIILTNTLGVPMGMQGVLDYVLAQPENGNVRSVNAVVGETNDGRLNDIRGRHVRPEHVVQAIEAASADRPAEGSVGAGTGTVCFGFKGGIGTASRRLPEGSGGYTVGVLVQTNFGGVLQISGVPVGELLGQYYLRRQLEGGSDGSCMMVVATDAPLGGRNLERLAKRAMLGLARTGGFASNGSGDYVIAFSTHEAVRIAYGSSGEQQVTTLSNNSMSPLFLATVEATEEAIINSLFAARTMQSNGYTIEALPVDRVMKLMKEYNRKKE
jgi:D-aminopeptidase